MMPNLSDESTSSSPSHDHEVLHEFARAGFELNATLHEMLNEHYTHRSERRGCGFTQATRHLAEHVNRHRSPYEYNEARLFADRDPSPVHRLVEMAAALDINLGWRNLDLREPPAAIGESPTLQVLFAREADRQTRLRPLPGRMHREESRLLARMIVDLVLPRDDRQALVLPPWADKLPIGTCPLAEKYFLELSDRFVRRKGEINVLVSDAGEPILVEKLNLGDDHSCVSLHEVRLNGVRLPAGSLLGVTYPPDVERRTNASLRGSVIPLRACSGFRFLRLTTLAVSCENRARAFTTHYDAQVNGGLFGPGTVTVEQLRQVAMEQL